MTPREYLQMVNVICFFLEQINILLLSSLLKVIRGNILCVYKNGNNSKLFHKAFITLILLNGTNAMRGNDLAGKQLKWGFSFIRITSPGISQP